MNEFTLIVPFYRNVEMLRRQAAAWAEYPDNVKVLLVDDGSPERAEDVIAELSYSPGNLSIYRIDVDIPWNRGGARNLGTQEARTEWVVHVDIDHLLTPDQAEKLVAFFPKRRKWYKFRRFRVGKADETRMKDDIPREQEYGEIHPHMDSYLIQKELYWEAGGYNENFSGCLGGGSDFLRILGALSEPAVLMTSLEVYTRSVVKDASDFALSRGKGEYAKRRAEMRRTNTLKGANPIRFKWHQVP